MTEIDLISLFNNNPQIVNLLKEENSAQLKPSEKISLELLEAYNMGTTLVKYLKDFGEAQRKQAALSKEDSEKYALLQSALKEAMRQAATAEPSPLKLIVEANLNPDNKTMKDQDYSYRISFSPA